MVSLFDVVSSCHLVVHQMINPVSNYLIRDVFFHCSSMFSFASPNMFLLTAFFSVWDFFISRFVSGTFVSASAFGKSAGVA